MPDNTIQKPIPIHYTMSVHPNMTAYNYNKAIPVKFLLVSGNLKLPPLTQSISFEFL